MTTLQWQSPVFCVRIWWVRPADSSTVLRKEERPWCCTLALFSSILFIFFSASESYGLTRKQRWISPLAWKITISKCVKVEFLWTAVQPGLLYGWNGSTSLGPTSNAWQNWNRGNILKDSTIIFAPFSFYLNMQFSSRLVVWCIILSFTHGSRHHVWWSSYVIHSHLNTAGPWDHLLRVSGENRFLNV